MKNRTRRVFCIMMTLVTLALTVLPAAAAEKTMQGVFGDDLTWRFTPSDNTLTVEGTGEMPSCLLWEFDYYGTITPWDVRKISDKIERVVIAEGVTAIGAAMFQGCTALREVQLPDSLRTIGGCAFEHTSLTEIRIPKNVEAIGDSAFAYCDLRTVTFEGTGVVRIDSYAFGGTPFLENAPFDADGLLIQSGHLLAAKSDLHGVCTVPEGVTDIAAYAFTDFEPEMLAQGVQITKVVFPESLKYIGDFAFDDCEKLKEAVFSSQDIRFGILPFQGTALSKKKIETYSAVDTEEPADAPAPTEYRIGAQDEEFDMYSYEESAAGGYGYTDRLQTYIVDPDNPYFKAVDGVLYSKDGSVLLRYPGGKTEDTFTVPQGVKAIGAYAFARYNNNNQSGLRKVVLPEGVTVIRECAFDSCANLEEVVLPSTLKTIDACAFSNVTALKAIELPDGLQEIGECFLTNSQVTHVRIPDSVESFRGGAFCGSMLQTIEGYDRIPYKSTGGMERSSFGGTPYGEALEKENETETTEPETEEVPEAEAEPQPEEPKHRNVFIVRDEANEPTTVKCIKVGFFQRYKNETLQLSADPDYAQEVHIEWRSDNKRVMVDENGFVTNRLHRRSFANIIVSAVDADGNVLLEKSVRLYFYRFDYQLRHLQKKAGR